jgi:hypothetical protein
MSRVDTTLPADAAEFCPSPNALQILVVGTYQLEDLPVEPGGQPDDPITSGRRVRRWGKCLVYETDESMDQWCDLIVTTIDYLTMWLVLNYRKYLWLLC